MGRTKVNGGFYTGWSRPTHKAKFLNAAQYRELFSAAAEYYGSTGADEFAGETGTDDWNSTNDVNWSDQAFQDGYVRQYNAGLTGGDARTKFLISTSYNDQKGIVLANRLNRGTARINIDHTINSIFKTGINISLNKTNNYSVPGDNSFSNIYSFLTKQTPDNKARNALNQISACNLCCGSAGLWTGKQYTIHAIEECMESCSESKFE